MKYICLPTVLIARRTTILCISLSLSLTSTAQQKPSPLSPYVKEDAPVLVLEHVRLIDGTGSAPQEDMRIDIAGGKITSVQAASAHSPYPSNAKVLEMTGKTVIPGLVGMHEHLFYPTPQEPQGGVAFYGEAPDSKGSFAVQVHTLADADDAARTVDYWAAEGVTSFKAYNYLTADELKAAIHHAHAHGLKITGHLCSIGFIGFSERSSVAVIKSTIRGRKTQ